MIQEEEEEEVGANEDIGREREAAAKKITTTKVVRM